MEKDLTLAIYKHSILFFLGALLYMLLSIYKLYLHYSSTPSTYAQKGSFIIFIKNLSLSYFITFLFKTGVWYPEIYENNKGKKILVRIVDGLCLFMKPYLVIGLVWYLIILIITLKLDYDPVNVTLGYIQELIDFIHGIPGLTFLIEHQKIIFLLLALTFLYVPFLFDHRKRLKNFKDFAVNALVYLSVLFSISLFGTGTGKIIKNREAKLAQLELSINAIHNKIFIKITNQLLKKNYAEDIKRTQDSIEKNIIVFSEALIAQLNTTQHEFAQQKKLNDTVGVLTAELLIQNTLNALPSVENVTPKTTVAGVLHYQSYLNEFEDLANASTFATYMGNPSNWNMADGTVLLAGVEDVESQPENIKVSETLELMTDYFVGMGVDQLLGKVKLGNLKFLGKLLKLVSSNTFVKAVNKGLYQFLTACGKPGDKITSENIANARTALDLEDKPPIESDQEHVELAKVTVQQEVVKIEEEMYRVEIAEKLKELAPYDMWHSDEITSFVDEIIKEVTNNSIADLVVIYSKIKANTLVDIFASLAADGYISYSQSQIGSRLYYRSAINTYIESFIGNEEEDVIVKKVGSMSIDELILVNKCTQEVDFSRFLEKLKQNAIINDKEMNDEMISHYQYLVIVKVDELAIREEGNERLRQELKDLLMNHTFDELKTILRLAENADDMSEWLLSMEGRIITMEEQKRYHQLCPCTLR